MGIFTECARCEQLRDEIKSLRGLLEKTEMRDILDRDFIPFESIGLLFQLLRQHREEWRKLIAERDAEIERLRGLLRDGLTSNIPEWKERVREALGG